MNTISRYQIFSPIPFIEFHPDIIYTDEVPHDEVDVNSNFGKYDEHNYNNIAFYIKDYNASMYIFSLYGFYYMYIKNPNQFSYMKYFFKTCFSAADDRSQHSISTI